MHVHEKILLLFSVWYLRRELVLYVENVKGSTSYSEITTHCQTQTPRYATEQLEGILSAGRTADLLTLLSPPPISSWAESLDYMGTVGTGEGAC